MLLWRGVSLIENGRANARVSCNPRHQDARSNMQESARGLSPIGANLSQYGLIDLHIFTRNVIAA
jgi:hypothetical protein